LLFVKKEIRLQSFPLRVKLRTGDSHVSLMQRPHVSASALEYNSLVPPRLGN
jgi:hypothetical protein